MLLDNQIPTNCLTVFATSDYRTNGLVTLVNFVDHSYHSSNWPCLMSGSLWQCIYLAITTMPRRSL